MQKIAVSGGFDPVHIGHLRMFQAAHMFHSLGRLLPNGLTEHSMVDVIVILNSDEWLMRKKGFVFMPFEERKEILLGFSSIYDVVKVDDSDDTVCEALKRIKPDFFGNGGDRKSDNVPEIDLCQKLGIKLVWNLGGDKIQSSSDLVSNKDA